MDKLLHARGCAGEHSGIAEYVIVPGDPFRCQVIAAHFDQARQVDYGKDRTAITGSYRGIPISVAATGMGCPAAAAATQELAQSGARVLVRLGGGFLMRPQSMQSGDIAITLASMKLEGTTRHFLPDSFPALADIDVVGCLIRSAQSVLEGTGQRCHTGMTACVDGFYGENRELLDQLRSYDILNIEMESAAIFTTCHRYGIRGACICACGVDDNSEKAAFLRKLTTQRQIEIVLKAIYEFTQLKEKGELLH